MKIVNPDYSVDMIVQRMRQAAARKASHVSRQEGTDVSTQHADFPVNVSSMDRFAPEIDIHPIALQPTFETNPDDRYHVTDLVRFSDQQFVQNAYRAVLKRQPDQTGADGLLESLRSGALNKIDVLALLRYSDEGREKGVHIEGLRLPALTRKLYRVPAVGYLLNLAIAVGRLPAMVRNQRAFENHVIAQQETLVSQINHIGSTLISNARQTAEVITQRSSEIENLRNQLEALRVEQAATHEVVLSRISELMRYVEERLNEEARERESALEILGARLSTIWQEQQHLLKSEIEALIRNLANHSEAKINSLNDEVKRLDRQTLENLARHQQLTSELILQGQRFTRMLEMADKPFPPPLTSGQSEVALHEESHLLDAFYAAFDDQFRGDRDEIKRRLKVYLPFVTELMAQDSAARLVDIGCGRGEWLDLLKAHGLSATGVDTNTVLAQQCVARGLEVVEQELLNYLREQPDESISVISGFHIVEHLPIETLVEVLNEAMRVLKSGGLLLLETPNPRNVLVGTCNFYFDPTHRNPLPSEVLRFLVESRGFARVEILPLNPSDEKPVPGDSELVERFNQYFYGPMDYGVVAWKPQPAAIPSENH